MLGKRRVVVFDSGIGGLNVLYECVRRVPYINYYYISDNANVPYGNKSKEEITRLTLNALKVVDKIKPSALVVACNTVTANCIGVLRNKYSFPVIGVQPAIKSALQMCDDCLVLATVATVQSKAFADLMLKYGNAHVRAHACVRLAEYIENNILNLPSQLPSGLLPEVKPSCVVLGCTHYSFVKQQIAAKYGCVVEDGIGAVGDHFAKKLGTDSHFLPPLGKIDHFGEKVSNITFLGADSGKNSQIFKSLNKNKCLKMLNLIIKN